MRVPLFTTLPYLSCNHGTSDSSMHVCAALHFVVLEAFKTSFYPLARPYHSFLGVLSSFVDTPSVHALSYLKYSAKLQFA